MDFIGQPYELLPDNSQSRTQSPLAFWSADGRQYRLWGIRKNLNFLIGCPAKTSIVLPQKSCSNKIPVPQSLYWRQSADQKARGLWARDWTIAATI